MTSILEGVGIAQDTVPTYHTRYWKARQSQVDLKSMTVRMLIKDSQTSQTIRNRCL